MSPASFECFSIFGMGSLEELGNSSGAIAVGVFTPNGSAVFDIQEGTRDDCWFACALAVGAGA